MHSIVRHRFYTHKNQERNAIYWSWSLKSFALSFVSIFLPIYLYQLGFSITTIFGFYLMQHAFRFLTLPAVGRLVARYGPKHVLAASFYMLLAQLGMFLTLPTAHWPLWMLALISAIAINMHFIAFHTDFSSVKKKDEIGREVSMVNELANLGSAIGPFAGGVIATRAGIQYSFAASMVILGFAVFPLFRTREIKPHQDFNLKRVNLKTIKGDLISAFGAGLDAILINYLWPLAIFLIVGSYAQVGAITTLSLLLALLISNLAGRLLDRGHWRGMIRFGTWYEAIVNLVRIIATTPLTATVLSVASEFGQWFIDIPYTTALYEHADRPDRVEYVVIMHMATEIGRMLFWLILLLLSLVSTRMALNGGFLLGAFGALLITSMRPLSRRRA